MKPSATSRLRTTWERLSGIPGGKKLFSVMLGRMAPYTGTISALVVEARPGYAQVQMKDRKKVRNHLRSIHAIAMMNLAEVTSGVAMLMSLPEDARGILTGLSIQYLKKGRGTLTAECQCEVEASNEKRQIEITAVIKDTAGDEVATATAHWLVGPIR